MEQLKKANTPDTWLWLANVGKVETWSKLAFNPAVKCDVKTNFVESVNATLGIDRCRSILTLWNVRSITLLDCYYLLMSLC